MTALMQTIVVVFAISVAGIVAVAALVPGNTAVLIVASVIGFAGSVIAPILAMASKMDAIHHEMNSMKDALIDTKGKQRYAEGLAEGKAESREPQ